MCRWYIPYSAVSIPGVSFIGYVMIFLDYTDVSEEMIKKVIGEIEKEAPCQCKEVVPLGFIKLARDVPERSSDNDKV